MSSPFGKKIPKTFGIIFCELRSGTLWKMFNILQWNMVVAECGECFAVLRPGWLLRIDRILKLLYHEFPPDSVQLSVCELKLRTVMQQHNGLKYESQSTSGWFTRNKIAALVWSNYIPVLIPAERLWQDSKALQCV